MSGEHIIASREKNIVKTAQIRLKTAAELLEPDCALHVFGVTGTPWNLSGAVDAESEPTVIEFIPPEHEHVVDPTDEPLETRGFHIRQDVLTKYGYTLNCPTCVSMMRGETKRKGHTE